MDSFYTPSRFSDIFWGIKMEHYEEKVQVYN